MRFEASQVYTVRLCLKTPKGEKMMIPISSGGSTTLRVLVSLP